MGLQIAGWAKFKNNFYIVGVVGVQIKEIEKQLVKSRNDSNYCGSLDILNTKPYISIQDSNPN